MKRLTGALLCAAGALLVNAAAAGDPADKITGGFFHAACEDCPVYGKQISAHESLDGKEQKGFVYIKRPDNTWNRIDLGNAANACVNVYEDGKARVGGMNIDGTGPGLGRYFGWELEDHGEPGVAGDSVTGIRFEASQTGLAYFLEWCASGDRTGNTAVWPHVMIRGNFQVLNDPADGD